MDYRYRNIILLDHSTGWCLNTVNWPPVLDPIVMHHGVGRPPLLVSLDRHADLQLVQAIPVAVRLPCLQS